MGDCSIRGSRHTHVQFSCWEISILSVAQRNCQVCCVFQKLVVSYSDHDCRWFSSCCWTPRNGQKSMQTKHYSNIEKGINQVPKHTNSSEKSHWHRVSFLCASYQCDLLSGVLCNMLQRLWEKVSGDECVMRTIEEGIQERKKKIKERRKFLGHCRHRPSSSCVSLSGLQELSRTSSSVKFPTP